MCAGGELSHRYAQLWVQGDVAMATVCFSYFCLFLPAHVFLVLTVSPSLAEGKEDL